MQKAIMRYIRGIKRSKISFIINLVGLTGGLACTFLIYLWVRDEMSFDKFHANDSKLYQVMVWSKTSDGPRVGYETPGLLADEMAKKIPGVDKAVAVITALKTNTLSNNDKAFKADGIYAGKDFFKLFSFDLVDGKKESALNDLSNIVISEGLALKLFGTTSNVIGKSVEFDRNDRFVVSGVIKNIPANSSLQFDYILSLPVFMKHGGSIRWGEMNARNYLLLNSHANPDQVNSQMVSWLKGVGEDPQKVRLFATRFSDLYLYGNYENGVQSGGRIDYVKLFSITGIIILLIACINFVSLSTAMATSRMKEVGMKKILGANRGSIIMQHLGESTMLAFLSLLLSILVVVLLLPAFNKMAEKHIELQWSVNTVLAFFTLTLLTGLLAGIYPAIYISRFNPMMVKDNSASLLGKQGVRKTLVVVQFAVSVILILFTIVVYKQFSMIQNRNLGYNKDNVVYFNMDGKVLQQRESFLAELKQLPGVMNASSMFTTRANGFFGSQGSTSLIDWPGKAPDAKTWMQMQMYDYGMLELLGIQIKEGRSLSRNFDTDTTRSVIFNETAINVMGLKNPVGTNVQIWGDRYKIIGVAKDFYAESVHEGSVKPMFIKLESGLLNTVMVKINGKELNATLNAIKEFHSHFNPGYPLVYKFVDQDFQKLYSLERRVSVLSRYFAGLAILISCLGLLGLTAFTVDRRKKEIGTRKVLGANAMQIVLVLYKDISKPVLIALLFGLPVGYTLTHKWLESFAIRIALEPWFFIVAGGLSFTLMLIASGIHVIKALSINPAESLRKE